MKYSLAQALIGYYYPLTNKLIDIKTAEKLFANAPADEIDFVIYFGNQILKRFSHGLLYEICNFEHSCCKLIFDFTQNKESNYKFFVIELSAEAMTSIFNENSASALLVYINTDLCLSCCKLSDDIFSIVRSNKIAGHSLGASINDEFFLSINAKTIKNNNEGFRVLTEINRAKGYSLNLQWHITDACQNKCAHCYLQQEQSFLHKKKKYLTLSQMKNVIDDIYAYSLNTKKPARVFLSGGDPLLSPDFWEILTYANTNRTYPIVQGLLGNPNLISLTVAKKLKKLHIKHIQFSLEGMPNIDAEIRGPKNWNLVWKAIDILENVGIKTNIMFTLSQKNKHDLIPLMNYCAQRNVNSFSFARYCSTDERDNDQIIPPKELKTILLRTKEASRYWLIDKNSHTKFDLFKDPLNALLYKEMGLNFYAKKTGCCLLGNAKSIAMLPDGLLLYCRRIPEPIGIWPDTTIEEALEKQGKVGYENSSSHCTNCDVSTDCRGGCRGIQYRSNPDMKLAQDLQCWRAF